MKKLLLYLAIPMLMLSSCANDGSKTSNSVKKNPKQETQLIKDAKKNAKEIIAKLSIEEKLAQLQSGSIYIIANASDEEGNLNFDSLAKYYPNGMGLMNLNWAGAPQEKYARQVNSLKAYNKTLKNPIPIIFIGEGLHGLMSQGNTVFPQAIALGCSFDTTLLAKVYDVTAREAKARGIRLLFSPILDLAREPRFGRIEEMYSEDPYLCGKLGSTAVINFQKRTEEGNIDVASTLKHYMGHGQVEGGRNVAAYTGSANDLLNNHLLPFEMAVKAGTAAVMPAYNDVCDLPVTVNKWLLQDVLRGQIGFDGLIISDQNAVDRMYDVNTLVESYQEAAELAIQCGIDVDIIGAEGTYQMLANSVKDGKLSEKVVDAALENLLVLKYQLGLFDDDKDVDIDAMNKITNCNEHKALARECAQKTMVLLENNGILPLDDSKIKTIAVIGQNATELPYGGYSVEPKTPGVTILEGIKNYCQDKNINVIHEVGCRYATTDGEFWGNDNQKKVDPKVNADYINKAIAAAKKADVVVLCVGENESFAREAWGEYHRGDRDDLELLDPQKELISKVRAVAKKVIIMVTGGRPLNLKPAIDNSDALIEGFYIGQEGGNAFADLIFGKVNFEAKLSVTMPHSVGSLPCYYNAKPNRFRSYVYEEGHHLYPFGYGISYSKYEYSAPKCDKESYAQNEIVKVSVNVKNISEVDGVECVQLYIKDDFSHCVRPIKEMRGFQKVALKAGESKTVEFTLCKNDLMYYDQSLTKVFEEGSFTVMVGPNSEELQKTAFEMK